jgi:hypothetical protein
MTTNRLLNRMLAGLAALALVGMFSVAADAQPPQAPPADPQAIEPGPPPPPNAGDFEGNPPPRGQFRGQRNRQGFDGPQGPPPRRGQFQDPQGPQGPRGPQAGHTPGECDMTGPHGKGPQGGRMQRGAEGGPGMGPGRPMGPPPFEDIDADGNGAITKAEWDQFHAQHHPGRPGGPEGLNRGGDARGPRGPQAMGYRRGEPGPRGPQGMRDGRGPHGPRAQVEVPGPAYPTE